MESIAININDVTYKKEERSFLSSLRNRLNSKIVLPVTINTDNTRYPNGINVLSFFSNSTPSLAAPLIELISGRLYLSGEDF